MWVEIVGWASILIMWLAMGINIYAIINLRRTTKKYRAAINYLSKINEMYELELERIKKTENENEL